MRVGLLAVVAASGLPPLRAARAPAASLIPTDCPAPYRFIAHGHDGLGSQLTKLYSALAVHGVDSRLFDVRAFLLKRFEFEHVDGAEAEAAATFMRAVVRRFAAGLRVANLSAPAALVSYADVSPRGACAPPNVTVVVAHQREALLGCTRAQWRAMRLNRRAFSLALREELPPRRLPIDATVVHVRLGDAMLSRKECAAAEGAGAAAADAAGAEDVAGASARARCRRARENAAHLSLLPAVLRALARRSAGPVFVHSDDAALAARELGVEPATAPFDAAALPPAGVRPAVPATLAAPGAPLVLPSSTPVLRALADMAHARVFVPAFSALGHAALLGGAQELVVTPTKGWVRGGYFSVRPSGARLLSRAALLGQHKGKAGATAGAGGDGGSGGGL